jgi:hypothetical protein
MLVRICFALCSSGRRGICKMESEILDRVCVRLRGSECSFPLRSGLERARRHPGRCL